MSHGYLHSIVAVRNGLVGKSLALSTENYRQLVYACELGCVNTYRVIAESHSSRGEPHFTELLWVVVIACKITPRYLENRSHTNAGRTPVQRIRAGRRQQYGVHIESRRGAEDSSDIGGIYNVFQNCDTPSVFAELCNIRRSFSPESTEGSADKLEACDFGYLVVICDIYGSFAAARYKLFHLSVNVAALNKKRIWLIACIESPLNYLGTFRYEQSELGLEIVEQLGLGKQREYLQHIGAVIVYFDDI